MPIKAQIDDDLKAALLSGDRFKGEVLRGLKAVILNEEISQNKRDSGLDDSVIEQLIAREVKKRNESAGLYDQAERPELSEKERLEAGILSEYLPKQLTSDEIQLVIDKIISEQKSGMGLPDLTISQAGQVIGVVKKELGNSADGAVVAELVKKTLSNK